MPAYAELLTPRERWAVVAWLRVLARSQSAPLEAAPPEVRQRLLQSLQGGTTP
jgi:mono/diheme cytochrome c family protein